MFEDLKDDKKSELSGSLPFTASTLKGWYVGAVVGVTILGILTLGMGRPGNPMTIGLLLIGGGGAIGALIAMFRKS